jgi:RHS repeat-associated protein
MNGQTLQKAFCALPGGATAVYNSSGIAYYRHSDWLGSSRFASTPSRTKYFDVAYAPYGEDYVGSGTTDLDFTGQNQDTVSGLYDFLYREYHPNSSRWIQPDPSGLQAASLTNPQTWNRYAYVANNPLAFVDPMGLSMIGRGADVGEDGFGCAIDGMAASCALVNSLAGAGGGGEIGILCAGCSPFGYGTEWKTTGDGGIWRNIAPPGTFDPDDGLICPPDTPECDPAKGVGAFDVNSAIWVYAGTSRTSWASSGGASNNSATPWYKNSCIQHALLKGAATAGLDAIGLLPEGGAVAAAFSLFHGAAGVSNGTRVLGRVALGGALISTAASLSDASGPKGGAFSFAGLQTGVNVLGIAKSLSKAIPVAGQAIAIVSVGLDIYGAYREIRECH